MHLVYLPTGANVVGHIHSHLGVKSWDPHNPNNENWSQSDQNNLKNFNEIDQYLVTPSGSLKVERADYKGWNTTLTLASLNGEGKLDASDYKSKWDLNPSESLIKIPKPVQPIYPVPPRPHKPKIWPPYF
jgi:hypothetical protein